MSSGADRQRRYRIRQARRQSLFRVLVSDRVIEALIDAGRLTEAESFSRQQIEVELAAFIEERAGQLARK